MPEIGSQKMMMNQSKYYTVVVTIVETCSDGSTSTDTETRTCTEVE